MRYMWSKMSIMSRRLWPVAAMLFWLVLSHRRAHTSAQSQNAIGAHRSFQKTSFSCSGRPSGYYADIETGCQVYHMCDGLGRQFSYSCPNTTLFQQRMLICDHWYMVNCSKAESAYTANLLIGQRDKPFVDDEESNLRTPRPDLLDRPYAPDYSGESFRNQYQKSLSSVLNQIYDPRLNKNKVKSDASTNGQQTPQTGQQRWKIPAPSRVILPPGTEPQSQDDGFLGRSSSPTKIHQNQYAVSSTTPRPYTLRPTVTRSKGQGTHFSSVAALHNRGDDHEGSEHDDLGTSHSTRYNTSADFNSAEDGRKKTRPKYDQRMSSTTSGSAKSGNQKAVVTTTTTSRPPAGTGVKVPSKIYEPPLLYPIYNLNETQPTKPTPATTRTSFRTSKASPFVTPQMKERTTTTTRPPSRATTVVGVPFTRSPAYSTTAPLQSGRNLNVINRFDAGKLSKEIRTPAPARGFQAVTASTPRTSNNQTASTPNNELPSKHLLPPLTDFVLHDVATTQGPPIYYEWKVPSDGLEPPKKDAPIGVDGREYPDAITDYNAISAHGGAVPNLNFGIDQSKPTVASTTRAPTARTAKETSPTTRVSKQTPKTSISAATKNPKSQAPAAPEDIFQIRKDLSVPEYAFPLENVGRTGYLSSDVYNSFQLKIPERRSDAEEHLHWYGENPKCPECHPSYVVPGTCDPCIRR